MFFLVCIISNYFIESEFHVGLENIYTTQSIISPVLPVLSDIHRCLIRYFLSHTSHQDKIIH